MVLRNGVLALFLFGSYQALAIEEPSCELNGKPVTFLETVHLNEPSRVDCFKPNPHRDPAPLPKNAKIVTHGQDLLLQTQGNLTCSPETGLVIVSFDGSESGPNGRDSGNVEIKGVTLKCQLYINNDALDNGSAGSVIIDFVTNDLDTAPIVTAYAVGKGIDGDRTFKINGEELPLQQFAENLKESRL